MKLVLNSTEMKAIDEYTMNTSGSIDGTSCL